MLKERDRQSALMTALVTRLANGTPQKDGVPCMQALISGPDASWIAGQVPIFQAVPKDTPTPFLCFREINSDPWGAKDRPGNDFTVNFLVVSTYTGDKEMANIIQALLVLLTSNALDLGSDGLRVVMVMPGKQQNTGPLSDGRTRTRLLPMRIIVEDLESQVPQLGG